MQNPDKTQDAAPVELFADVAARAGAALADLVDHPDCPDSFAQCLSHLDSSLQNEFASLDLNFRYHFPALAVRAAEEAEAETDPS
jgi:hypothetical protein